MRVHSRGSSSVPAGGTVDFLNSDRLLHNIHATPKLNASFNRTQPKSRTIPITFDKPEIVRINCDLHSWMAGWVVVAAHPFYADHRRRTDSSLSTTCRRASTSSRSGTNAWGPSRASVTVGDQQAGARHRRDEGPAEH